MQKIIIWSAFGLMAAAQLFVPASMIAGHEIVLQNGTLYRFKTAPVDPYDAFRGRFVSVRLEGLREVEAKDTAFEPGEKACAYIGVDEAGFGYITHATKRPEEPGDYLYVEIIHTYEGKLVFKDVIDRYYMPEDLAPEAERAYREHSRNGDVERRDAFVTVRVRSGKAVLEDLYVAGKPIREFLNTHPPN